MLPLRYTQRSELMRLLGLSLFQLSGDISSSVFSLDNARMKLNVKIGAEYILGDCAFCRLGCVCSKLRWVSLHSTQPTFFRCSWEIQTQQRPKY
jgi:hypothetical protein